jgi:uncharacterized protein
VNWFQKAAEQGYADAQYKLGVAYDFGRGVPQNYAAAKSWFQKAAEQGNAAAQSDLGFMYVKGHGVPQDYAAAMTWFQKAAEQGNATAQFNLGNMYFRGRGVPQDYVLAQMWFILAAAVGESSAAQYMTPAQIAEAQKLAREWKPTAWIEVPHGPLPEELGRLRPWRASATPT